MRKTKNVTLSAIGSTEWGYEVDCIRMGVTGKKVEYGITCRWVLKYILKW
jgi:hypothetical protein